MAGYRERIYGGHRRTRAGTPAPDDLAGLESRGPYLRRLVARHFPPDRRARVLDLGCGHGALLHVARLAGYRDLRGVDVSAEQVAAAARLGIAGVEQADLLEALGRQEDGSLDVVVAFDVLEHFTRDELLPLLDAVHRSLAPGGRLILHVPNGASPFFGAMRYGDITHEMAFTSTSLEQILLASGFSGVACHEDTPVVHGAASALRWVVWKAVRILARAWVGAEAGGTGRGLVLSQNLLAVAER